MMPRVVCNDILLHYDERGEGAPLVFLHGIAGDHLYWKGQMRAFARRFRCLAPDNRDAGQSGPALAPYTMRDLAADVAGLLDALGLPEAHLVGLSLGGMIALEMAVAYPSRVRSLFLVGTVGRVDDRFNATLDAYSHIRRQVADTAGFLRALLPWLVSHRFFESPSKLEWLQAFLGQCAFPQTIDGFFRQLDAVRGHDVLGRASAIRCPAMVVVGEDDRIAPLRYAEQLAGCIPRAGLHVLPGVGHSPVLEDSRGFSRLLDDFLGSVPGGSTPG
jgi:pimeloyl-ACP methyl ester carboxylesterase